jgi:hypothetical protein
VQNAVSLGTTRQAKGGSTASEGHFPLTALPEFNLFGERTPPPPPPKLSFAPVYEAYARAGGTLNRMAKAALGQQAKKLTSFDGYPIEQVARAAGELGRTGVSPSYLGRTVREMPEPCTNGSSRARLTQAQLASCSCSGCREWHQLRGEQPLEL